LTPGVRRGGLGALLALAACDAPVVPLDIPPYEFRLPASAPDGSAVLRTFHWGPGVTVPVLVAGEVPGRPDLRRALERAVVVWDRAAIFGEARLRITDAPSQAYAVLEWDDAEPILTAPVACVGPSTGSASTRGCLTPDGEGLEVWPLRDGTPSRVLFRVHVRMAPGMDELRLGRLVAHEMGHVLGILNHSTDPTDLMWPGSLSTGDPSPADRVTLRTLYRTPRTLDPGAGR